MKKPLMIIMPFVLLIVILGILASLKYPNNQTCPWPHNKNTTEENIALMRANLERISGSNPDLVENGHIFLKDDMPVERFVSMTKDYEFIIPDREHDYRHKESIRVYSEPPDDPLGAGIAAVSLEPEHFEINSFYEWAENSEYMRNTSLSSIKVRSFHVRATLKNFNKLWKENDDVIRGIGVGCTDVNYLVNPTDPVIMSVMSSFDRKVFSVKLLLSLIITLGGEIKEFFE
ncbi:MAG: hypothetical protein PHW53_01870 [Patescibacteria group bacterium]|nr:hypothetical protein [Patescibacteria group bacterium]